MFAITTLDGDNTRISVLHSPLSLPQLDKLCICVYESFLSVGACMCNLTCVYVYSDTTVPVHPPKHLLSLNSACAELQSAEADRQHDILQRGGAGKFKQTEGLVRKLAQLIYLRWQIWTGLWLNSEKICRYVYDMYELLQALFTGVTASENQTLPSIQPSYNNCDLIEFIDSCSLIALAIFICCVMLH